jgi:hypothetical protein
MRWDRTTSFPEASWALSFLIAATRDAVARLDEQAARGGWAHGELLRNAQVCLRELSVLELALGWSTPHARVDVDVYGGPVAVLARAYSIALSAPLPRAVHALLMRHVEVLRSGRSTDELLTAA